MNNNMKMYYENNIIYTVVNRLLPGDKLLPQRGEVSSHAREGRLGEMEC